MLLFINCNCINCMFYFNNDPDKKKSICKECCVKFEVDIFFIPQRSN